MKNPPDIIENTEPIYDIENAFDIELSDDDISALYDMSVDEAAQKIFEIQCRKYAEIVPVPIPGQTIIETVYSNSGTERNLITQDANGLFRVSLLQNSNFS